MKKNSLDASNQAACFLHIQLSVLISSFTKSQNPVILDSDSEALTHAGLESKAC